MDSRGSFEFFQGSQLPVTQVKPVGHGEVPLHLVLQSFVAWLHTSEPLTPALQNKSVSQVQNFDEDDATGAHIFEVAGHSLLSLQVSTQRLMTGWQPLPDMHCVSFVQLSVGAPPSMPPSVPKPPSIAEPPPVADPPPVAEPPPVAPLPPPVPVLEEQKPPPQKTDRQSVDATHARPSMQRPQLAPPQSTSVSAPFF